MEALAVIVVVGFAAGLYLFHRRMKGSKPYQTNYKGPTEPPRDESEITPEDNPGSRVD